MNDLSFVIALVFYFVMLGLITYWLAYQTVRVIRLMQKIKTTPQQVQMPVEVQDLDPNVRWRPAEQEACKEKVRYGTAGRSQKPS